MLTTLSNGKNVLYMDLNTAALEANGDRPLFDLYYGLSKFTDPTDGRAGCSIECTF